MVLDEDSTPTIAAPVKMVVRDGIVMGPTVSYIFKHALNIVIICYSIVLLIIVLRI